MSDKSSGLSVKELFARIDNLKAEKDALEVMLAMVIHQLSDDQRKQVKERSYEYHDAMSKLGDEETKNQTEARLDALNKILNSVR